MKKPKQVLFPNSIKKLQERLATIDAMQGQITMKSGRSVHQGRRSAARAGNGSFVRRPSLHEARLRAIAVFVALHEAAKFGRTPTPRRSQRWRSSPPTFSDTSRIQAFGDVEADDPDQESLVMTCQHAGAHGSKVGLRRIRLAPGEAVASAAICGRFHARNQYLNLESLRRLPWSCLGLRRWQKFKVHRPGRAESAIKR
jgi:hypothetical protein